MVKQKQEQKQNVKVVVNLGDTIKKKKKRRRRRIREPPQGKSSFQQILQANQAPQVVVRRIYDESPYLDELQRLRSQNQGIISRPADGVKQPSAPLTSQAEQRKKITTTTQTQTRSRLVIESDEGIPATTGERMSMPTNPNTSALQGTPEPPAVDAPAVKRGRGRPKGSKNEAPRSDKGMKRDTGGAPLRSAFDNAFQAMKDAGVGLGYESEGGFRGFSVIKSGREMRGVSGAISDAEREQTRAARLRSIAGMEMYNAGTNAQGQV